MIGDRVRQCMHWALLMPSPFVNTKRLARPRVDRLSVHTGGGRVNRCRSISVRICFSIWERGDPTGSGSSPGRPCPAAAFTRYLNGQAVSQCRPLAPLIFLMDKLQIDE